MEVYVTREALEKAPLAVRMLLQMGVPPLEIPGFGKRKQVRSRKQTHNMPARNTISIKVA